jgi:hypothetical protein
VYGNPTTNNSDGDGILDGEELSLGADGYITDAMNSDTDNDTINDYIETITGVATSFNGNSVTVYGNPTTQHSDNDTIVDGEEFTTGSDGNITNPMSYDSDGDGLADNIEIQGWDTTQGPSMHYYSHCRYRDYDNDSVWDAEEKQYNANPYSSDTDGDGASDYIEIREYLTYPWDYDCDDDGLNDLEEKTLGADGYITNAFNYDSDTDGFSDYEEVNLGVDGYLT